jgi:beta-xylosidase
MSMSDCWKYYDCYQWLYKTIDKPYESRNEGPLLERSDNPQEDIKKIKKIKGESR